MRQSIAPLLAAVASFIWSANALGQQRIISFESNTTSDALLLAGGGGTPGQILVSENDYWGVIRAAGDLAVDFGRVTGVNFTLSNGHEGAEPAEFVFEPVNVKDNTNYSTIGEQSFYGPKYSDPDTSNTVIIAGTIGHSTVIDELIEAGKIDVSAIDGEWEAFITQVVRDPIPGCSEALVIAGSMPRGTIYGIYDISEQIGVSPWYFWADVAPQKHNTIYALSVKKTQASPSVKYRGIFLNDEQPGLTNWVSNNWPDTWNDSAGYNYHFYALVAELLLRLRANYLWPAIWGSIIYTDDPYNQPLLHAYEIVLGSSHTEPLMRAQNEFRKYYQGAWAYNENNKTIDEYFRYGVQRAKPYARNSLWTMGMRGTGDTAIEGLGIDAITAMLETLVGNQRQIMQEGLEVDDITEVPQLWCLYKEVQGYIEKGLQVPDDVTLLWADDNWGNVRRLPLANETERSGGAGVYYHFDYVGGPRDYKWINTIQLSKTTEQMQLAYARKADRVWIVNVGDLKPLEIPISHFMDMAYDAKKWDIDSTESWIRAWVAREFGTSLTEKITSIVKSYGKYAARRKFELVERNTYSVLNYNEAERALEGWQKLEESAQAVHDSLDEKYRSSFFQMILHPVIGGRILHEIYITAAKNSLYAGQKRNSANVVADKARELLDEDAELTMQWNLVEGGKWANMLDQTHIGYDSYWQQPMRNSLPPLTYVQTKLTSLAGEVRLGVEGSNASIPGDDQWHDNSGNTLTLPPLGRYGAQERWFDVFSAGTSQECSWTAAVSDMIKLSETSGVVGAGGNDTRVLVSVDWERVPEGASSDIIATINVTSPCRDTDKSRYSYDDPVIKLPINTRSIPETFTSGFVESDKHVAIEAAHFQRIAHTSRRNSSVQYHVLEDYGRTLSGVGLWPADTEKLQVESAPALEYDVYLFTNNTLANVTLHLSPTQNYLGNSNPLQYALSLSPAGESAATPKVVQFVGLTEGGAMPRGWDGAVADAVWGVSDKMTTTSFPVADPGPYTLRVWCLLPSVIVQRIVIDLGGVRKSYLGPPESYLVGSS